MSTTQEQVSTELIEADIALVSEWIISLDGFDGMDPSTAKAIAKKLAQDADEHFEADFKAGILD